MIGPFMPPITPYIMPEEPFDNLIKTYGIRLAWLRGHPCPCTYAGDIFGSAQPECLTCQGRGHYWDEPSAVFMSLITWVHVARTPDEPGFFTHGKVGIIEHAEPTLTIPYQPDSAVCWEQATLFDAFVEVDASARYISNLQVGQIEAVAYQHGLQIAPSGAVTVWDPETKRATSTASYAVSGAYVRLDPDIYPPDTAYMVEFIANPTYVMFDRAGGGPHVRPFGGPVMNLPRRYKLQALDLWTRARQGYPDSTSPVSVGAGRV